VVDYAIHYAKSSGKSLAKVFKLREVDLLPGQKIHVVKKQLFKDLTTRKHYRGKHNVDILVNGKLMGSKTFVLEI
jgi:hypothetical protein